MSNEETDFELVKRVQKGEKGAFDLLVLKYEHKIVNLVMRYVRDQETALDISQEAFIKAYRALPRFRGDSAFYTWLYRIGINTAKNHLVAMGRRAPTSTELDAEEAEGLDSGEQLRDLNTPENQMMSRQVGDTVNQTLLELPEELRTALTLREIEGLSYEEIAAAMQCPVGTVRSRIFRAREAVAEKLRPLLGTGKDRRW
jgi:RNA polymerase sigma-70 factor (ECF subfamily)